MFDSQNLQERIASLQNMFETLTSTENELRRQGVSLSPTLQNRIDQLYRRWKQLQIQLLQRQHAMQEAYSSIDMSSIQGLQGQLIQIAVVDLGSLKGRRFRCVCGHNGAKIKVGRRIHEMRQEHQGEDVK